MIGINFKNDSWRNLYKKARAAKDQKEQAQINQAVFDYIQCLQLQIDELSFKVRELEEKETRKKYGRI